MTVGGASPSARGYRHRAGAWHLLVLVTGLATAAGAPALELKLETELSSASLLDLRPTGESTVSGLRADIARARAQAAAARQGNDVLAREVATLESLLARVDQIGRAQDKTIAALQVVLGARRPAPPPEAAAPRVERATWSAPATPPTTEPVVSPAATPAPAVAATSVPPVVATPSPAAAAPPSPAMIATPAPAAAPATTPIAAPAPAQATAPVGTDPTASAQRYYAVAAALAVFALITFGASRAQRALRANPDHPIARLIERRRGLDRRKSSADRRRPMFWRWKAANEDADEPTLSELVGERTASARTDIASAAPAAGATTTPGAEPASILVEEPESPAFAEPVPTPAFAEPTRAAAAQTVESASGATAPAEIDETAGELTLEDPLTASTPSTVGESLTLEDSLGGPALELTPIPADGEPAPGAGDPGGDRTQDEWLETLSIAGSGASKGLKEIDTLISFEQFDKAKALLDELLESDPDNPEYQYRAFRVRTQGEPSAPAAAGGSG